jgi:hypothetical protein
VDGVVSKENDEILATARERFKQCIDIEAENREEALDDILFYEGHQWPEKIKEDREADQRPCLVINKIPLYVRQITNEIRQMKPGVKVRGVDSASDPKTAEMMSGMIRAIERDSAANSAYQWGAEHAAKMGWGYWRIVTEYADENTFDQVIKIKRIKNQFSVYCGPCEDQDASDANFMFITRWMPRKEFEARYPDAKGDEWSEYGQGDIGEVWFKHDAVRVAEYWEKTVEKTELHMIQDPMSGEQITFEGSLPEGVMADDTRTMLKTRVVQRIITGGEVLETNPWEGKYIPIVRCLGREEDVEGEPVYKGMIRDSKDAQRQYNYMRSASVERIALAPKAPFVGPQGAFANPKWRSANVKNYAYLEWDTEAVMAAGGQPPRREAPPDVSPGLANEINTASQELKDIFGIYNAGLGDVGNEVSGVAIDSRRSESDVSNFDFSDNYGRALVHTGRILVDLIPKIYTGARVVKILNPDESEEQVRLNQPYVDPNTMQPREFNLEVGRYDVVVDIGPSYATQRKESAQRMMEMVQAYPDVAPLIGDLLAKSLDWQGADELAKRLRLMVPPEVWAEENPQFKAAMQQKDQMIQMLQGQMGQLQQAMQQMQIQMQNKEREQQIKAAELAEKARSNDQKHVVDMTGLELEAQRDLNSSGVAY